MDVTTCGPTARPCLPRRAAFQLYLALLVQVAVAVVKVSISPEPKGLFRAVSLDPTLHVVRQPVVVTCDATGNYQDLIDLFLEVTKGNELVTEEKLTTRSGKAAKTKATKANFRGNLTSKTLVYTMNKVNCGHDGLKFKCITALSPSGVREDKTTKLNLEVGDGDVQVSPASDINAVHLVGDTISLRCSALIGAITNTSYRRPAKEQVEWRWETRDDGRTAWEALPQSVQRRVEVMEPIYRPCYAANSSSRLPITLQESDNLRAYRCAYRNRARGDEDFNLQTSGLHQLGQVNARLEIIDVEARRVVYSSQSLIGLILGMGSFIAVCFLGMCYIYRKNRTGKKYDIVKTLLKQEEAELTKLETRLGIVTAVQGVIADPSTAGEERSAVESSVAESSTAAPEPSAAESSTALESSEVDINALQSENSTTAGAS